MNGDLSVEDNGYTIPQTILGSRITDCRRCLPLTYTSFQCRMNAQKSTIVTIMVVTLQQVHSLHVYM